MPPNLVLESKPQTICSIISEFALEYRTCRERVLQQIQKKATHRERNKTRGKMITEVSFLFISSIKWSIFTPILVIGEKIEVNCYSKNKFKYKIRYQWCLEHVLKEC